MDVRVKKTLRLIMATAISVAIFTGCGIKNRVEETVDTVSETVEENLGVESNASYEGTDGMIHSDKVDFDSVPEEFADIKKEVYDTIPTINAITIEQLFSLSVDQLRAFVSLYAPDYKTMFQIDNDLVMEEEHWNTLRSIISYQLFGTIRDPNKTFGEFEEDTIQKLEENALIRAQDYASGEEDLDSETFISQLEEEKKSILNMDKEAFITYINDMFAQTGYVNEDGSPMDVGTLDEETLDEMKESIISDIDNEIETLGGEPTEEKSIQDQLIDMGK